MISIPLVRHLEESELELVQRSVAGAFLDEDTFESRARRPRSLEEALSDHIPAESLRELSKSFDIIGDIAVLESTTILGEFEEDIGMAIMNVHPSVRAVLAKIGPISGTERIAPLRHIAGENRTETVHHEFGCSFKVDLSKVFFSPRLSTEHQRIAKQVLGGENVVDMFAGVGSFSILIARNVKNATVDAIDSNPTAAKLIQENARANKVDSRVQVHFGDAREAVRELGRMATRVIMNHPSAAKEFVDAACSVLQRKGGIVHYYTFVGGENSEAKARSELESAVKASGHAIRSLMRVHKVREVAPVKWQVAIDAEVTGAS